MAHQLMGEVSGSIQLQLDTYLKTPHLLNQTNNNVIQQGYLRSLKDFESFFLKQIRTFDSVNYIAWANDRGEYIDVTRLHNGKLNITLVDNSTKRQYYIYEVNSQGQRGRLLQNSGKYHPRTRPWYKAAFAAKRATILSWDI